MKKVLAGLVAVSAIALTMIGCGIDNPLDTDTVDITLALSASTVAAGQSLTATGTVDGSSEPTITYTIEAVSAGNADHVGYTATAVSGKNKVNLATDAALTVTTTAAACNGTYNLIVKGVVGATEVTKTVEFTVTGGTDCSATTLTVKATDTLFNITGPKKGAYDLVTSAGVSSTTAATTKDLLDVTGAAPSDFEMVFGTGNGTKFAAATTAQYTAATNLSVAALGDAATLSQTAVLSAGDVVVAKLGGSRGYAIIKVLDVTPDGASNNSGFIVFEYKFTN